MESNKQDLAFIILAAGFGSRMKNSIPKCMNNIGNVPLIEHVLQKAKQFDVAKIVCVLGPEMKHVEDYVKSLDENVSFAVQTDRRGTGDAVKCAKDALSGFNGTIVVLYADTVLFKTEDVAKMVAKVESGQSKVAVMGFDAKNPYGYGRLVVDESGFLTDIVEEKEANDKQKQITLCNSGIIAACSSVLWRFVSMIETSTNVGEYYLTSIVDIANKHNVKCSYVTSEEKYLKGINTLKELADAEYIFQTSERERHMSNGVTLVDQNTVYFSPNVTIGKNVVIQPNVYIYPNVTIGCNAVIKMGSIIEPSTIGNNGTVGPYSRLRKGTVLKDNVSVGNFVEIKNSTLDNNTKANHLSYIGDSEVGANVNIGAGVITCNYDGVNKHKTKIGDNSFIGSNTSLIAPLSLGKNVITGAGSVINKGIEDGSLAISRPSLKTLSGYYNKFKKNK